MDKKYLYESAKVLGLSTRTFHFAVDWINLKTVRDVLIHYSDYENKENEYGVGPKTLQEMKDKIEAYAKKNNQTFYFGMSEEEVLCYGLTGEELEKTKKKIEREKEKKEREKIKMELKEQNRKRMEILYKIPLSDLGIDIDKYINPYEYYLNDNLGALLILLSDMGKKIDDVTTYIGLCKEVKKLKIPGIYGGMTIQELNNVEVSEETLKHINEITENNKRPKITDEDINKSTEKFLDQKDRAIKELEILLKEKEALLEKNRILDKKIEELLHRYHYNEKKL